MSLTDGHNRSDVSLSASVFRCHIEDIPLGAQRICRRFSTSQSVAGGVLVSWNAAKEEGRAAADRCCAILQAKLAKVIPGRRRLLSRLSQPNRDEMCHDSPMSWTAMSVKLETDLGMPALLP
ncbi:hypothetical protein LshimejAT787_0804720 [Lyophyllum shimeji]|uniref:Uncharacterized protein n=1 Tax=Lyophyllum shimeji TaxID=47721 RepID=A0A9P3URX4_LYOSH|nr:hypothetical protein LshimejAT787_0804720 [Lyophyllum shimeji]